MRRRARLSLVLLVAFFADMAAADPARDLLRSARLGDLPGIQASLEAGAGIDKRDPAYRQTALIRAAMFGQADAADALIQAGANPRLGAWPDDMQALHWAAQLNDTAMVSRLLHAGIDPDSPDDLGGTPLDYALSGAALDTTDLLLARGASPENLSNPLSGRIGMALNPDTVPTEVDALLRVIGTGRGLEIDSGFHRTALLALAARANRPGAERFAIALLVAGANPAATDDQGRTPLALVTEFASRQKHPEYRSNLERVAQILREAGSP